MAFTIGLGLMINPSADNDAAYAESGVSPMSVDQEGHIALNLKGAAEQVTTATADQVSYRLNQFDVVYSQTSQYAVQVNSMNGYGSSLFGQQNPQAEITGVGTDKTPAQFGNNTWGYAIGEGVSDGTNLIYNTVPEYNTQTKPLIKDIVRDNITDAEQTDSYTLSFAAKIGSDSPADHYVSKVYLSVVRTPGRVYTVIYNANKPADATGEVTGTPPQVKFTDTGNPSEVFKLSTDVLKLKKYKFLGWTTDQANSIFTKDQKDQAAAAVQYPAGSAITFPSATETTVALYAVWLAGGGSLLDIDTMQEMTVAVCQNEETKVGDSKMLEDTRDHKKYWVTRLNDGSCWMTQNLDYDGGGTKRGTTGTISGWQDTNTVAQYYDHGMQVLNGSSWVDVSGSDWTASTSGTAAAISGKVYNAHYLAGNYYSWPAAMNGNTSATGNVQGICPDGWMLPSSPTSASVSAAQGSWSKLFGTYNIANSASGSTTLRADPFHMYYFGQVYSGGSSSVGSGGLWWSFTPNGSDAAYRVYIASSFANPHDNGGSRYGGNSVRCVNNPDVRGE